MGFHYILNPPRKITSKYFEPHGNVNSEIFARVLFREASHMRSFVPNKTLAE